MEVQTSETDYTLEFLSNDEKSSIAPFVLTKIAKEWENKLTAISNLKTEVERYETNYVQRNFENEKEAEKLRQELELEINLRNNSDKELASFKEKFSNLEEELQNANDKAKSLNNKIDALVGEKDALSAQTVVLAGNLESKTRMYNVLKEQTTALEEQLTESQKTKCEALLLSEEANSTQIKLQFKERHFEQEKGFLSRQIELLQRQLEEKSNEILTMRHEHSKAFVSMQGELGHFQDEVRSLRNENSSYSKDLEDKNKKIEDLLKSLNEVRESEASLESVYKKELSTQERLANIYKDSNEDQKKRCEELETAVEELKQLLREAGEQFGALEKAKMCAETEAQKTLNEREVLIKELKDELDNVNELLRCSENKDDDMADLSPSAAAAHQLMEKGLSLSQLYTEYLNTSKRLFKMEDENKRLSRYMEQILKEIAEKAPVLTKQREDYEKDLDTINTLHLQNDDAIEELEKQRIESEEAKRRSNFLGRENDRLSKQVKDLSKQVSVLLTQVEAARSGLPPPSTSVLDGIYETTNAGDVIEQHLVSFRSITELQEQNLKLITSLRDLSDKMESAEHTAVESKTQELTDELETARKDLEDLKAARDRMQVAVENITRQRDVYRTIVNQQGSSNKSINGKSVQVSDISSEELGALKEELEKAKKETEKVKKEYEEYRVEKNKNEKMVNNELQQLKTTYEKTKMHNVKLLSQAEYDEERLKALQKNCEAYLRQVNALTEKNDVMRGIVGRHESSIETLRENVLKLTKDLAHAESALSNLKQEKMILKETEAQLRAECESLRNSQYSQALVVSNLEAIKNNLNRMDTEVKMAYENQISDLTKQCCSFKAKLESNVDLKEAQMKVCSMTEEIDSLKKELAKVREAFEKSGNELDALRAENSELQQQNRSVDMSSPGMRPRLTSPLSTPLSRPTRPSFRQRSPFPHASPPPSNSVRELQVQLSEEKAKNTSLQQALQKAESHVANLQKITDDQETRIKDNIEGAKAAEVEINKLRTAASQAEQRINQLSTLLNESQEKERAIKETSDSQLMSITEDLEERENELEEAQRKVVELNKATQKAREELAEQSRICSEIQDKYEREVMLHGADLEAMASLKEKMADFSSQVESLSTAKLKAEEYVSTLKEGFEQRQSMLEKTTEELRSRIHELEDQNKTLLDQLTEKLSQIQEKISASSSAEGAADTSLCEEDNRSLDQLREIMKYLRRERELAVQKFELSEAEAVRLRAQKKSVENKLAYLNKCLEEEREKNQGSVETNSKYIELMRKVHTMDALADSNRMLRHEKDSQKNDLLEAKAKVTSLQSQIDPLQENLRLTKKELESIVIENKSLENSRDSYKKRTEELVEKLNRTHPEDMIRLQQEVGSLRKDLQSKESELTRLKTIHSNMQKIHQATLAHKNQLVQQIQTAREESKKLVTENRKLVEEKARLQTQSVTSAEKIKTLETSVSQSAASQQQEQQRNRDQRNQVIQQLLESRQKEETTKEQLENAKKALEEKDASLKAQEAKLFASSTKITELAKQCNQLRRIANKYKMKVESSGITETGEPNPSAASVEEDNEEKKNLSMPETSAKKDEVEKLTEEVATLKEALAKMEEEKSELPSKLQAELDLKTEELQKAIATQEEFKQKFQKQLNEVTKNLLECQSKKVVYEGMISKLEQEKAQLQQQIETLNKKLSMQQKLIENMQKMSSPGQKTSSNIISIEKPSSDPPPTANIKPMAVPPASPVISSPRSQPVSQPGSSRSIPTASIRPMAPTSLSSSSGQSSSVVVVPPLEMHSGGDGAVSSTVTLPQATVTPTPVAPAATTTLAFPSSLTATVSPITSSATAFAAPQVASVLPRQDDSMDLSAPTTSSSSSDALISQAIAMITPHLGESSSSGGGQKRKRRIDHQEDNDEDDDDYEPDDEEDKAKRSRIQHPGEMIASLGGSAASGEELMDEDMGEPSSSSATAGHRKVEAEVFVLSSDDDEDTGGVSHPPTQSGHEESHREMESGDISSQDSGEREAEAERRTEGDDNVEDEEEDEESEVPSAPSSSSPTQAPVGPPLAEHPSSSSRQRLPHFQPLSSQYEEGMDDRMVPSTPTLVVPRTCEGVQGDGVSSVQVPSQGFEFGSSSAVQATTSNDGLAEMAGGDIIDVSRIDFAQLDENSRPLPSTSSQRRNERGELSTEGRISSSEGDSCNLAGSGAVIQEPVTEESSEDSTEPDSGAQIRTGVERRDLEGEENSGDSDGPKPDRGVPSSMDRRTRHGSQDRQLLSPQPLEGDNPSSEAPEDMIGEDRDSEIEEVSVEASLGMDEERDPEMEENSEGDEEIDDDVPPLRIQDSPPPPSLPPLRATRSTRSPMVAAQSFSHHQSVQRGGRTITPIRWNEGSSGTPASRAMFRGGARGGNRGVTPSQMQASVPTPLRHQHPRGVSQRGRRSRPMYYSRGGPT